MKGAFPVNGVIQDERSRWHPFSRRDTQNRSVPALRASNPKAMRVQYLLNGLSKFSIFFDRLQRLPHQGLQTRLQRQPDGSLNSIQLPLQRLQHLARSNLAPHRSGTAGTRRPLKRLLGRTPRCGDGLLTGGLGIIQDADPLLKTQR